MDDSTYLQKEREISARAKPGGWVYAYLGKFSAMPNRGKRLGRAPVTAMARRSR